MTNMNGKGKCDKSREMIKTKIDECKMSQTNIDRPRDNN